MSEQQLLAQYYAIHSIKVELVRTGGDYSLVDYHCQTIENQLFEQYGFTFEW